MLQRNQMQVKKETIFKKKLKKFQVFYPTIVQQEDKENPNTMPSLNLNSII
jgi:hypothetical protein